MNNKPIVDVRCVEHVYPDGTRVSLCGQEFQVFQGQRVAVLGPNGSGKSTLLKHILGLLKPTEGFVSVFGIDPSREYHKIRPRIGVMMQNADEQLIGPTVFDDIAFAPLNYGFSQEETTRRVDLILEKLGIFHLRDRLPHYLSGGERKKVALAGALVFGPELLVMDEPLQGIDYTSRLEIVDFLKSLHRDTGLTMICTTHDMEMVADLADFGYVMRTGGRLELYGSITELFFEHDLNDYNLAPPSIAQLIQKLGKEGFDFKKTLDLEVFYQELLSKLRQS